MKYVTLLFVLSIFSFGCKSSTEPAAEQTIRDVYPLKVGSSWTYAEESNYNGTIIRDTSLYKVEGTAIVDGISGFNLSLNGSLGFWYYYAGNDLMTIVDIGKVVIIRYPSAPNVDVVYRDSVFPSGYHATNFVRRMPDMVSVTVPAGTFNCVHLHMTEIGDRSGVIDTTNIIDLYLAPGIGEVKQVAYIPPKRTISSTTIELIAWK